MNEKTKYNEIDNPCDFSDWNPVSIDYILSSSSSSSLPPSPPFGNSETILTAKRERVYPIQKFPASYFHLSFLLQSHKEHEIIAKVNRLFDEKKKYMKYSMSSECRWSVIYERELRGKFLYCKIALQLFRFLYDEEKAGWVFAMEIRREDGEERVCMAFYDLMKSAFEDAELTRLLLHKNVGHESFSNPEFRDFYTYKPKGGGVKEATTTIPFPILEGLFPSPLSIREEFKWDHISRSIRGKSIDDDQDHDD